MHKLPPSSPSGQSSRPTKLFVTAISPLYKLIWPLHVRIRGNWAESVSTLRKNGAIVRSLGDTGTKMAPSLCWDFKLSNEGSFVEIGQEMTKLGWKVWKKSLQSLRAELQSLRAESIAVCMQRWSVLCPGKPPSTGPKWKFVLSLEFLRTQQWGLGLDFKSSGPNPIFHDFSCGPYLQLRIAVPHTKMLNVFVSNSFVRLLDWPLEKREGACASFVLRKSNVYQPPVGPENLDVKLAECTHRMKEHFDQHLAGLTKVSPFSRHKKRQLDQTKRHSADPPGQLGERREFARSSCRSFVAHW